MERQMNSSVIMCSTMASREEVGSSMSSITRDRIDFIDVAPQAQRDVLVGPELFGTDLDAFERLFARQIFLRQRGPLIRRVAIAADHQDRALVPVLAECDSGLGTPVPRPHDNDVVMFHRRAG